ncbi:hypothetical protein C8R47DRAFT_1078746 [Mycena vitilis]|nr:hypothetical protein C8R47DRAFT_1078746 [Mycena vitilis]
MSIQSDSVAAKGALTDADHALKQMLSHNAPPSEGHAAFIRALLGIGIMELDQVNSQIEQANNNLAQLIARRDTVTSRLTKYRSVLSPIRRMPAELLCEIFLHTAGRPNRWDPRPMLPHQVPFVLGQISRLWRNVAINLPSLWNNIDIYDTWQLGANSTLVPLSSLKTQLARSRSTPLVVTVESWSPTIDFVLDQLHAILPHSNHWLSLSIVCAHNTLNRLLHLLQSAKGQLSQLKRLQVDAEGLSQFWSASDLFLAAPHLCEVILTGHSHNNLSPPFVLPWTQLTSYRGYNTDETLLHVILPAASNLVEAALAVQRPTGYHADVTLPHLRRLCVDQARPEFDDPVVHPDFLANLTVPQLEYLAGSADLVPILHLLQRSSCKLTTLVLRRDPLKSGSFTPPGPDLIAFLQCTPSLTHFVLQASIDLETSDLFLCAMRLSGSPTDLCPRLVSFAYGTTGQPAPYSPHHLTSMVRSRLYTLSLFTVFGDFLDGWGVHEWTAEAHRIESFHFCVVNTPQKFINNACTCFEFKLHTSDRLAN